MKAKSEEVKAEAKRLLREGISPTEIARRLSVGRATVYRWKKAWETEERGPRTLQEAIGATLNALQAARTPYLTPEEEEKARAAVQVPAGGIPSWIHIRGPRDRQQYLECLAEAKGDLNRVARRGPGGGDAPWIVLPPALPLARESRAVIWNRIFFGKERRLAGTCARREEARADRIKDALTPEYITEYMRLEKKARQAVGYDVEPPAADSGARPV